MGKRPHLCSKNTIDRSLLHIGEQVAIAAPHFFRSVANKVVDDALVDTSTCEIADEAVA